MLRPDQILVIYDGHCGVCSQLARAVRSGDWRGAVVCLPWQTPGLLEASGIRRDDAARTVIVLSPGGRVWKEFGAVAAVLDELLPGGLPILRLLSLLPGIHQLGDTTYRLAARHRGKLGRGPADLSLGPPPTLDRSTLKELERRRFADRMPSAMPPRVVD